MQHMSVPLVSCHSNAPSTHAISLPTSFTVFSMSAEASAEDLDSVISFVIKHWHNLASLLPWAMSKVVRVLAIFMAAVVRAKECYVSPQVPKQAGCAKHTVPAIRASGPATIPSLWVVTGHCGCACV